jgi:hypothetical protein
MEGQSHQAKIFLFIRISDYHIESHPNPAEGRIAIVTNAGWDVVDAGASARGSLQGGSHREQQQACTRPVQPAYGKIVWS